MAWLRCFVAALAVSPYTGALALALPVDYMPGDDLPVPGFNQSEIFADYPSLPIAPRQDKVELRILSLGASIMTGALSTEGSG